MAARTQHPGMHWPWWQRDAALRKGLLEGVFLSCVFVTWLVVANRVREFEPYAGTRNLVAAVLFAIPLVMPAVWFWREPGKLFRAGLVAWTVFTLTYLAAEIPFTLLESRIGGLHLFMLGGVSYGIAAGVDWVFQMCAVARHAHFAHVRQSASNLGRQRTR